MTLHRTDLRSRPYALYALLWGLLLGALIVVPIMIYDRGYFIYYGDFNVQQIPFYQLAHDSIQSGNTGWSHLTDLGANFIGSYSFYLLGSPFFWLTMLLPSAWVPYAMGPLLILKLGLCSLSAYIYLRRYVHDKRYAILGGLLYAFSSFSVYNIFFFHFHEPMIIFPLLLAAVDEFHMTKRRGVVALTVCASALVNYYFFFGQVIFVAIYYVMKLICRSYRFKMREFISLAVECVLGLFMSGVLLLPSIAAITGNYRVSELLNGWNALIYPSTQRYIQILVSFFFPGDIPARNNFTASAGAKWSSIAAYLPVFSMIFVIAYLRAKKGAFFRRLLLILLLMAFVPILNSMFQALNVAYYARWFYMLTLMMTAVTVRSFDDMDEVDFKKGFFPTLIVTGALTLYIGLMPEKVTDEDEEYMRIGLSKYPKLFWAFAGVALLGLGLAAILYAVHRKKPKLFFRLTALILSVFIVGYTSSYLWIGKMQADKNDDYLINRAINGADKITLSDLGEVRSDFYEASDNMGMFLGAPTINAFHSIVPGSVIDFYNLSGVTRDVGSRPTTEFYGFRALLSVKYLFADKDSEFETDHTLMPGYDYLMTEDGFDIYENKGYIPMGFTFDSFITEEEYTSLNNGRKHLALLKAMVLSEQQMEKHADIVSRTETSSEDKKITDSFHYSTEDYFSDVEKRKENCCSYFSYTDSGFEAEFENKGEDNLLFFSVPYDAGWTAYVDGEEADIEIVDIGFMAVRVKGHATSSIEFRYKTPMLKEGLIVSCAALAVFIFYLIVNRGFTAERRPRRKYRINRTK